MQEIIAGKNIVRLQSVNSTNSYAQELLSKGRPEEGTVVWTENQHAGRGQRGNVWESEPCKNLTFSIIYYPDFLTVEEQFLINKAVSIAVVDFVSSFIPQKKVYVKWPNDILVETVSDINENTVYKKVSGILIENTIHGDRISSMVIGIGLNVNQTIFSATGATSLKLLTSKEYELENCLKQLLRMIEMRYLQLKSGMKTEIEIDYRKRQNN